MKLGDLIFGLVGLVTVVGALLFVRARHVNDPVIKRPDGVPNDAGVYGAKNDWIRCLNTNQSTVFECEVYTQSGELIHKGTYLAPGVPTLPLIIKGAEDKEIAVKDQLGHRFFLKPRL